MSKFDAGIGCGELPVDLALVVVGRYLPGGQLAVEYIVVGDAAGQALSGQGREVVADLFGLLNLFFLTLSPVAIVTTIIALVGSFVLTTAL